MANLSIRWRLIIAYGVILTAVLAGFALFLFQQQESFLMDSMASRLEAQALDGLAASSSLGDAGAREAALAAATAGPAESALVLRPGGSPIRGSPPEAEASTLLDTEIYERATSGNVQRKIIDDPSGGRLLAVVVPARDGDGDVVGLLQVNGSLGGVDSTLTRLRLLLSIGVVSAHVLGTTLAFAVTSWSLRPLTKLVETCRAIARGSYGERADLPKTGDELGEVAAAFDNMLDEVQSTMEARERSEATVRRFAADASHELKSPLTVVAGYLDVLRRGGSGDGDQLERALEGMSKETDRMSRLVGDLVTLAHLEAGGSARRDDFDLAPMLRELGEEGRLRSTVHDFEVQAPDALLVRADVEGVRRAMRNLLDNAIRHTPPGGKIRLGLTRNGATASISIADTGEGIEPQHLPHVFNRFYRVDAARARSEGSAGLGLAITKAIAEANGGSVAVESEPGGGSVFTLRLPTG